MFKPMVEGLLNIEQFCQENSTKSQLIFLEILLQALGMIGKPSTSGISYM